MKSKKKLKNNKKTKSAKMKTKHYSSNVKKSKKVTNKKVASKKYKKSNKKSAIKTKNTKKSLISINLNKISDALYAFSDSIEFFIKDFISSFKKKKITSVKNKDESVAIVKTRTKRDVGIEVLRVLACLAVCTYHIRLFATKIDGTISETYTLLECMLAICVMSFFLITGFFIYNKKGNLLYNWLVIIKNTIINIIIPTILVVSVCVVFNEYFINVKTFDECVNAFDLKHVKEVVIAGFKEMSAGPWPGTAAHLWYIFAYLYIVISYPVIKIILDKCPRKLLYIILLYLILIGVINDIWIFDNDYTFHKLFDYLKKPVIYAMVGNVFYNDVLVKIRDKETDLPIKDMKTFFIGMGIYVVSLLAMFYYQYNYYVKYDIHIYVYSSWLSMFSLFMTIGFMLIVYNINFEKLWTESIKDFVLFVSKQTFMIFLIHYLIVIRFVCTGIQDAWHQDLTNAFQYALYYLFYGFFIFAISFTISVVITFIPDLFTNWRKRNAK